jgi:hypothetical protein
MTTKEYIESRLTHIEGMSDKDTCSDIGFGIITELVSMILALGHNDLLERARVQQRRAFDETNGG